MLKRITAVFTSLCLAAGLMPLPAFAEGDRPAAEAGGGAGLIAATAGDAEGYYVATNGDDGNPGTKDAPFATIAYAASKMKPGDTCYIRGGTYRERLVDHEREDRNKNKAQPTIKKLVGTADAPITFQAYNGEKVTLTGCDPVTNWTKVGGPGSANVWRAPMGWDMYVGKELGSGTKLPEGQEAGIANGNLVFANGALCIEGRWPNAYTDAPTTAACGIPDSIMDLDRYARTDAGTGVVDSTLRIVDAGLATATAGARARCRRAPTSRARRCGARAEKGTAASSGSSTTTTRRRERSPSTR